MARNWTDEQKTAIRTTDKTVLLSAAAGSGKTATLTERLIRMVTREDSPLDVSRMLVVTFTRDAAEELRVRISAALDEALQKDPQNKSLLRAALLLPSAKIRTIDSFCNDLVKGHTETLGIKGHYRIPDAAEAQLLCEEILDGLITDAYDGRYAPSGLAIANLSECTVGARNEKDISRLLEDLYGQLEGYPDGIGLLKTGTEMLCQCKDKPFFKTPWGRVIAKEAKAMLCDHKAALETALAATVKENDTLFLQTLAPLCRELCVHLDKASEAADLSYTALRTLLSSSVKPKKDPTASDAKLTESGVLAKQYRKRVLADLEAFKNKYLLWEEKDIPEAIEKNASLSLSVYLLLLEFDRRFREEKRSRGLCTYSDLERFAYTLLRDEKGARTPLAHELAASFDAVCIDEYQDVNDIQHSIFDAISTPKNRFMVGDIKQSIYCFRGAKPDIFASLRRSFPSLDEDKDSAVLYLTKNFRSHPHLIRFNNAVFDFLFGKMGESIDYMESDRLVAGRPEEDDPPPLPCVTYLHTPARSTLEEWDVLAEKIKELLENGKREDGEPLKPSDIAVLYRQGAAKRYEISEALSRHGIPVLTEDTQSFFSFPEVLLALCLLNTVNNPLRDVYLAGLLRSPLYGFTMEELLRIRRAGKKDEPLYTSLVRYTSENPDFLKGAHALEDIRTFRKDAEGTSADKLCHELFEKTTLFAIADEEGKSRLRLLYDYARTLEANHFHGLYRFVAHLNELIDDGRSLGAKRMLGCADGVKVATMHASKGLEYPVTFIVNTSGKKGENKNPLFFHPSLGIASYIRDGSGLALLDNPIRRAIAAQIENEENDEEIRVLYVALTRASRQMYVLAHGVSKPETVEDACRLVTAFPSKTILKSTSHFVRILAATASDPTLCTYEVLSAEDGEDGEPTAVGDADAPPRERKEASADEGRLGILRERFSFVYPHAALSALPGKISVSKLYPDFLDERSSPLEDDKTLLFSPEGDATEKKEKAPTVPCFISGKEKDAAAKAGTATHLFLQFCRFEALAEQAGKSTKELVEAELSRLVSEKYIDKRDAVRVRTDELARFAASPLLARILAAKEVHREFRFHTMLDAMLFSKEKDPAFRGHSILTQGVIDLLLENPDGSLSLCDYKTDRLTQAHLSDPEAARAFFEERHAAQLSYYAAAVEQIFGKAPKSLEIYSLHAARSFEIRSIL